MSEKPTYQELEQRVRELEKAESERKRAEEAMRESQDKYRNLFNNAQVGIFRTRISDGKVLECNNRFARTYGYKTPEECKDNFVVSKHYTDPGAREKMVASLMARGEVNDIEACFSREDGDDVWVRFFARAYPEEGYLEGAGYDITEEKRTLEALRKSEERYRSLVETMSEGLVIYDENNLSTYANDKFCQMLGYANDEIIRRPAIDFLDDDNKKALGEQIRKRRKGKREPYELDWLRKDGKKISTVVSPSPIFDVEARYAGAFAVVTDISELKENRNKLEESVSLLSATLDATADGILVVDRAGKIVSFNKRFVEMWRIPDIIVETRESDQALTFVMGQIKNPESFLKKVKALYARPDEVSFDVLDFKDGRTFERFSQPQQMEGKSVGRVWSFRDVTVRKKAEEALRESEEKYRQLSDSLPQIVFETDEKGNLTFTNRVAFDILGYTREDFEKGLNALQMLIPEDHDRALKNIQRVLKGEKSGGTEYTALTKDGRRYPAMVYTTPIIGEGKSVGMRGIVVDLTEVKRAQKALLEGEEKVARSSKMEAIGTMAGGVAHDLNNILGGLVSYPELLLLQLPEDSPLRKSILTIQRSGEKAAAVVQDLLTLARRSVVVTEVVNLNDVVDEYLKSPEHERLQSYHPTVHMETHLEKESLNILGSSTHLSKTVMNLVSNAAEAMSEGGALTVSTENRYIDRPVRGYDDIKEGDYVVLTVSDAGTGIASDDMEKIFEPFYTKKKMGRSGTGLGMAVVWGTVKDHKGYIDVQSTEGEGTTFTLYFPVTRKLVEKKSEISLKDCMGKGEEILVVDDVEEQRKIASGMLKELGYSVVSAPSGEEAVEYLKTNKVDLLVLDMIMEPGMDGLDTYKKIIEIHPGQKAIIASGFSETDRVKEIQRLGAGAYIRKPLLLEKIGIAVKEELKQRIS